jgi:xanthine dehydrogenase small subunit
MQSIYFLLGNKIQNVVFNEEIKPTTTLLKYLRSKPDHKGTKEGCGEGDCGACTVVVAELGANDTLIYKAINSCLVFLPWVHGKQIITVEHLGTFDQLHPVQQAMVSHPASQCGFCTPGFVMSAFALFKSGEDINEDTVNESLVGNLCRCTGYKPIREAILSLKGLDRNDQFSQNEKETINLLKQINLRNSTLTFSTGRQHFFLTFNLRETLTLAATNPDAIKICGSTDAALRVTKKHENLGLIIDFSNVPELKIITETETHYHIGAGTSLQLIKSFAKDKYPEIYKVLGLFGSKQIRNRATIGGNICISSPISDLLPILMADEAIVEIQSTENNRQELLEHFVTDYRQNSLTPDELLTSVVLPKKDKSIIKAYKISKRKDVDIATVNAAFRLKVDDGKVQIFRAYFGGMAKIVKKATKLEAFMVGKPWEERTIEAAKEWLMYDFTPISDARASANGRMLLAQNLLTKFWLDSLQEL